MSEEEALAFLNRESASQTIKDAEHDEEVDEMEALLGEAEWNAKLLYVCTSV